jgi:hypothetical protein
MTTGVGAGVGPAEALAVAAALVALAALDALAVVEAALLLAALVALAADDADGALDEVAALDEAALGAAMVDTTDALAELAAAEGAAEELPVTAADPPQAASKPAAAPPVNRARQARRVRRGYSMRSLQVMRRCHKGQSKHARAEQSRQASGSVGNAALALTARTGVRTLWRVGAARRRKAVCAGWQGSCISKGWVKAPSGSRS